MTWFLFLPERMGRISRYLVLEIDGEQYRVEEDSILYLEARNHTVLVETDPAEEKDFLP